MPGSGAPYLVELLTMLWLLIARCGNKYLKENRICYFWQTGYWCQVDSFIAVFNNIRTLKFKAQLTIGFFVNHNYGQRTLKLRNRQNRSKSTNHNWKMWPVDLAEVSFCFPNGPLRWLTAVKNVNRWLRFEFQSSHDTENRNNIITFCSLN